MSQQNTCMRRVSCICLHGCVYPAVQLTCGTHCDVESLLTRSWRAVSLTCVFAQDVTGQQVVHQASHSHRFTTHVHTLCNYAHVHGCCVALHAKVFFHTLIQHILTTSRGTLLHFASWCRMSSTMKILPAWHCLNAHPTHQCPRNASSATSSASKGWHWMHLTACHW